jgi:hypothetical protein
MILGSFSALGKIRARVKVMLNAIFPCSTKSQVSEIFLVFSQLRKVQPQLRGSATRLHPTFSYTSSTFSEMTVTYKKTGIARDLDIPFFFLGPYKLFQGSE